MRFFIAQKKVETVKKKKTTGNDPRCADEPYVTGFRNSREYKTGRRNE